MARLMTMPGLAAAAEDATLDAWHVDEGAEFASGDVLASVEIDKAVAELPAEADGVLVRALVTPGTAVAVGAPIAVLGEVGEQVDVDAFLQEQGVADVVGTEPQPAAAPSAPAGEAAEPAPEPAAAPASAPAVDATPAAEPASAAEPQQRRSGRIFISPLARRLARDAGLDPADIPGSGPNGRVTRRDVEAAVERAAQADASASGPVGPAAAVAPASAGSAAPGTDRPHEDVPHSRVRQAIARRLTQSKQTAPHFYLRSTVRVARLLELRRELNEIAEQKISVNHLLIKAVGSALLAVPDMNVAWHDEVVRRFGTADVGVAVASERGLVTPVLRSVEAMGLTAIAAASRAAQEGAESGSLGPEDFAGGSICISNLGMYGIEEFTAIINPPQAAILAVGAVRDEVVARDGQAVVEPVMHLVLSVDHRPVDGVVAARFMDALVGRLEEPRRLLL